MCFDPGDGKPLFITDHDASSPLAACYKLDTVVDLSRLTYYAAKTLKILRSAVPPP